MTDNNILRIGLIGMGTVGGAFLRHLHTQAPLLRRSLGRTPRVMHVIVRHLEKSRSAPLPAGTLLKTDIASSLEGIDVLVELAGGTSDSMVQTVKTALTQRIPVVTANKAMLANTDLLAHAAQHRTPIGFEAAVGGGTPIIQTLSRHATIAPIRSIGGIVNGTCNFLLTHMEQQGQRLADTITQAQNMGLAEANPTLDLNGTDSAHKLALLCYLSSGALPNIQDLLPQPLTTLNPQNPAHLQLSDLQTLAHAGLRARLITKAWPIEQQLEQRWSAWVGIALLPHTHTLTTVSGSDNAIYWRTEPGGTMRVQGPGAGGEATAHAALDDLIAIARNRLDPPRKPSNMTIDPPTTPHRHYVRGSRIVTTLERLGITHTRPRPRMQPQPQSHKEPAHQDSAPPMATIQGVLTRERTSTQDLCDRLAAHVGEESHRILVLPIHDDDS